MFYRHRVFLSIFAALAVSAVSFYLQLGVGLPSDLSIPHCAAQKLLTGNDPYSCPTNRAPSNPITTVIAMVPFAWLPVEIASAIIVGLSSGLLAYALNRKGKAWCLLTFFSMPFIYSVQVAQWVPLLLATAFITWLYPMVLIKPHIGVPIAVMNFTYKRGLITGLVGLAAWLVYPGWLWRWWEQSRSYDGFIPLLVFPFGIVLLTAALRWRDTPARWLLLLSLMPQRLWYDQLMLYTIPQTQRQMIILVIASWLMWLPYILWGDFRPLWAVVIMYYPALLIALAPAINQISMASWLRKLSIRD